MESNNMKSCRLKKGLSMKDLSFKTQISERYLYFIENGEKTPSLKTAQIISNSLETSIEDIFFTHVKN
jgi:Predicted transcriptional regulators